MEVSKKKEVPPNHPADWAFSRTKKNHNLGYPQGNPAGLGWRMKPLGSKNTHSEWDELIIASGNFTGFTGI